MSKWIEFEFAPTPPGQKTQRFLVKTKDGGEVLGEVKWFGRWRKYCFFPAPGTIFEEDCLEDISRFIQTTTFEYRARPK
jgi:hypothetical protein